MNIILFTKVGSRSAAVRLDRARGYGTFIAAFALLCAVLLQTGYWLGRSGERVSVVVSAAAQVQINTLAQRVGQLQAQAQRLDALGRRLSQVAGIDPDDFNLNGAPAVGGPQTRAEAAAPTVGIVQQALEHLVRFVDVREQRLNMLDRLLWNRGFTSPQFLLGIPAVQSWVSSGFGERSDPFTGHMDFHNGVDFAGQSGSAVAAAADGVVIWAGTREGYGRLVEIDHGNGFVTRYGHNSRNLVRSGEVVSKGQTIALMGSSGRSTGPHVHFEVLRDGAVVDPAAYVAGLGTGQQIQ